jgi:acylphosphatase
MQADPIRRKVVVQGRVQGVFFRDSVRERASACGVAGWVTNRSDGAVEAVLEGSANAVSGVVEFMRSGPPRAKVSGACATDEKPEGLSGFEIR